MRDPLFVLGAEAGQEGRVPEVEAGVGFRASCEALVDVFEGRDPADLVAVTQVLLVYTRQIIYFCEPG